MPNLPLMRARLAWIAALLLVLALAAWWSLRGQPVDLVRVGQGPLQQSVVSTGRVASVARIEIASQTTAAIDSIAVREGDSVRAGDVLVRLRDDEATANLRAAQAAVAEAQARLRQIDAVLAPVSQQQLEQARATATQAQQEYQRAQDLHRQGFIAQARLDEAQRAALTAQAGLLAAQAQAQGNLLGGAERAGALARVAQAQASAQAVARRLDLLTLRAPVGALVTTRNAEPGDTAQPARALLTLESSGPTRIHTSVDEKNLQYIRAGQSARVVADAYAQQPFSARLRSVAPAVDAQRGTVELKLDVDQPPAWLRPDMTVSVEIVTAKVAQALILSTDALRRDAQGQTYVLVLREGRAQRVDVKPGLQGVGSTQIVTGLAPGEQVILPTTAAAEGERVRARGEPRAQGNVPPMPGFTQ